MTCSCREYTLQQCPETQVCTAYNYGVSCQTWIVRRKVQFPTLRTQRNATQATEGPIFRQRKI